MKTLALSSGVLAAALMLSSCFEQHETVTIKPDGSGTVISRIEIKNAEMWNMATSQVEGGPLDEAQYQKIATQMGEGVTFQSVEKFDTEGGGGGVTVTFNFTNADTLQLVNTMDQSSGSGGTPEPTFSFNLAGDQLTITNEALVRAAAKTATEGETPAEDPAAAQQEEMGKQMMAAMAESFKGAEVETTVVIEGGIKQTNASFVEGNTITLVELPFDDLMKNENWSELVGSAPETAEDIAALNAIEGIEVEPAKEVTVTISK